MAYCRHCGNDGLLWLQTPSGWKLAEHGIEPRQHRCPEGSRFYRERYARKAAEERRAQRREATERLAEPRGYVQWDLLTEGQQEALRARGEVPW